MRRGQVWCRWAIIIALPVIVGACAATPRDAALPLQDPNEHANRQMLAVNQEMMRPVAEAVQTIVPRPMHDRLRDFNLNLKEPRIFVNNLLQGRLDAASKTAARFAMNTTFGIGGLVDLASLEGIPQQTGDFGQTLFVWGVGEGPYMVRPYWGPTTTRDAVGDVVDRFGDPVGLLFGTQLAVAVTTAGLDTVVRLGQLKQAEDASIDFYASCVRAITKCAERSYVKPSGRKTSSTRRPPHWTRPRSRNRRRLPRLAPLLAVPA